MDFRFKKFIWIYNSSLDDFNLLFVDVFYRIFYVCESI